ncbi:AAA domain-containing protein [Tribonema minus]|uniref:AAA domain-containing protein n=1 Tax=Tribonema minus TaxID=303371 RepID=A0A835YPP4_9STRA|nr:AAA domain-containing protein [Tribonema minus]
MVCLYAESPNPTSRTHQAALFGMVSSRDKHKLLPRSGGTGSMGISFGDSTEAALGLVGAQNVPLRLAMVCASYFVFRPVLKALQSMSSVPFEQEIVMKVPVPLNDNYLPQSVTLPRDILKKGHSRIVRRGERFDAAAVEAAATLDKSQCHLPLCHGRAAGKMFIGALIARTVLHNARPSAARAPKPTIVCICYTNHALDQFLEHLLKAGITRLARISGRSTCEALESHNLRALAKRAPRFSPADGRRHYDLKSDRQEVRHAANARSAELTALLHWNEIVTAVSDEWCKGAPSPPRMFADRAVLPLWQLDRQQRQHLLAQWRCALRKDKAAAAAEAVRRSEKLSAASQELRQRQDLAVLRDAQVVGVTTTKAAGLHALLEELAPTAVILEEAGEVLEAHALTAVSATAQQLIMIRDHKQLRPKVETHALTVEANRGHALKRSLFERLITAERCHKNSNLNKSRSSRALPHAKLAVQRRMRPEISALVRACTYPVLRDAESVLNRPALRGVARSVVFVTHCQPEGAKRGSGAGNWRSGGGGSGVGSDRIAEEPDTVSLSKVNGFEVELTVEVVRYLLQQGYRSEDVVVLTPYLGQMRKLKHALGAIGAFISDMDAADLRRESGASPTGVRRGVRVATVDNYQGEESDIIVASLVRSNAQGNNGFLREPERASVLLSRARNGLILIGNDETLRNCNSPRGRELWNKVLDLLSTATTPGLPIVCQRHPRDPPHLAATAAALRAAAPDGGCARPCGRRLKCGHACPLRCHPRPCAAVARCAEPCARAPLRCPRRHACPRRCWQACGRCEAAVDGIALPCGHGADGVPCWRADDVERVLCSVAVEHTIFTRSPAGVVCTCITSRMIFANHFTQAWRWCLCVLSAAVMSHMYIDIRFEPCGHTMDVPCAALRTGFARCAAPCGALLPCGHVCPGRCGDCCADAAHAACAMPCERTLGCGHECAAGCHGAEPGPSCQQQCSAPVCTHATSATACHDACAPCVMPCAWSCEHCGPCPLPCTLHAPTMQPALRQDAGLRPQVPGPLRGVIAKYQQHQERARRAPTKVIAEACPGALSKVAAARPAPDAAAAEAASSMAAALATDAASTALTAPLLDALLTQGELCAQLAVATASAAGRGGAGDGGSQIGGGSGGSSSSRALQDHDKVVQLARSALTEAMLSADERGGSSGLRVAARARLALARVHLARTPQQQVTSAGASVRVARSDIAAARRLLTWITERDEPSVAALHAQAAPLLNSLPPPPAAAADHDDSDAMPWCEERCEVKADGCVAGVYRVPATAVEGGAVTRDAEEFRKACGQFYHLLGTAAGTVTRVDVYETSKEVREAYQTKRHELSDQGKSADETWVFHGTRRENVERICAAGFKIGGRDSGVRVANGSSYGQGVYTATGPGTPMGYTDNNQARLCWSSGARGLYRLCT